MSAAASASCDLARLLERTIRVTAVRVPSKSCGRVLKALQPCEGLLSYKRVKAVLPAPAPHSRLLLLREGIEPSLAQLPEAVREALHEEEAEALPEQREVRVGYESMGAAEALRRLLPEGVEAPAGFETVGHIAHLNLQEAQLPHRHLIGRVMLDKNDKLRTVVNKLGNISSEFRVFEMEVIAGERDMVTEVREHGCRFRFDFSKVYWNSKLQTEHRRVVDSVREGEVVCDLMCGVGPFAVPLAARGRRVLANDLNPESYRWLRENARLNRVDRDDLLTCANEDARAFFRRARDDLAAGRIPRLDRLVMNLPASALEFLDVLRGEEALPLTVHCYCFAGGDDPEAEVLARAEAAMGRAVPQPRRVRLVRNVAPSKDMYCLEFRNGGDGQPLPGVSRSHGGGGARAAAGPADGAPAAKRTRTG